MLLSNPGNPNGQAGMTKKHWRVRRHLTPLCASRHVVEGKELSDWVELARDESCLFMMDEFYSHYMYEDKLPGDTRPFHTMSSAEFVHDVNVDPICIINGLTKNWRLPGWRVCWVVGPKHCVDALSAIGSFMDGGAPHPLQIAGIPLLDPRFVEEDALALQAISYEIRE